MSWQGLDPGLLALGLLAVTALLLFLHRQRPPARRVTVPSLALWLALEAEPGHARALRSRATPWLSFLLTLTIACLLVLSLGDPTRSDGATGRNVVLLIDCSASMAARDVPPSRLAQAKQRARALVHSLGDQDHAWVVALTDRASVQTPRSARPDTLLRAIDALAVRDTGAELAAGVQLARDLLAPYPGGELVLFSDGALTDATSAQRLLAETPGLTARFEPVGSGSRNVALTRLAVRPYLLDHAHREVLVQLSNLGAGRELATLRLWASDTPLLEERIALPAGATVSRVLPDLPSTDGLLRARIELADGPDFLSSDDQLELFLPPERQTRVLLVSRGNRYLEAALLLDDTLAVSERAPSDRRDSTGFDVVIFDGVLPAEPPASAALYLGPIASEGAFPLQRQGELERPFFARTQQTHPLVRELALGDVNIARAAALTLAPGDVAVASTAARQPLIVEGRRAGLPFVVLGFDLRESDLPLRAAFPLLFLRTLEHLRPGKALAASTAAAPDSQIEPRTAVLGPVRAGSVAARIDGRFDRLWPWLCALALLLSLLELLSFHRGWTP